MPKEQLSFDSIFDEPMEEAPTKTNNEQPIKQNRTTFPIHLVVDFNYFIDYIKQHHIDLTKTKEYITRQHLPLIDEQMSMKAQHTTAKSLQEQYAYIHLFYHLALSGQLVEKSGDSGKPFLKVTPRWNAFSELTDTEKYFFLLETFWVDTNWNRLLAKDTNRVHQLLPDVFAKLLVKKSKYQINLNKEYILANLMRNWDNFLLYIEWFGLWVLEKNQKQMGHFHAITLTPFGINMIAILQQSRNLQTWNIPLRHEYGEINPLPGSPLPDTVDDTNQYDQSSQTFHQAFASLFPKRDLHDTLPRVQRKFTYGVHTFKVALNGKVWRKVSLSAKHTMEDLHTIIIRAFGFDDDHLYSFFMDGKKWSHDCIVAPHHNADSPNAREVTVGSVGMHTGQQFIYLFDYGDEWIFKIKVEQIQESDPKAAITPSIVEQKGNAPDQYFCYD